MKRVHRLSVKTKQQWEIEMMECLDEARRALDSASELEKPAAREKFRLVLSQYNQLVLNGKTPPEEPCYM
jgi:hypothetical protein